MPTASITTIAPLERRSLADTTYDQLLQLIVSGHLQPGERIRDQLLAAELGVSRTPVREALRRLVDDGLVETEPHASTRVTRVEAADAKHAYPVVASLQAFATRRG